VIIQRRAFITGLVSLMAAPAIVRVASLMPVKVFEPGEILYKTIHWQTFGFYERRPIEWASGTITADKPQPLMHFWPKIRRYGELYGNGVYWRPSEYSKQDGPLAKIAKIC